MSRKFKNNYPTKQIGLWTVLKWWIFGNRRQWPKWVQNTYQPQLPDKIEKQQVAIIFINHATCLIQTATANILTDPVWAKRASPFSFMGPKRVRAPGLDFEKLPKIDCVLISHNHYDHLDRETLKKLQQRHRPVFVVPLKNEAIMKALGITDCRVLNWWKHFELNEDIKITMVPAQHFSGRGLTDRDTTLWGSYVIENKGMKVFFAGDTGYSPHFKEILERFGAMDVSLLPIGAYDPAYIMQPVHLNPEEAVRAHLDLKSKYSIAIHFGTFQLTDEGIDEPTQGLKAALAHAKMDPAQFRVLQEGETFIYQQGV